MSLVRTFFITCALLAAVSFAAQFYVKVTDISVTSSGGEGVVKCPPSSSYCSAYGGGSYPDQVRWGTKGANSSPVPGHSGQWMKSGLGMRSLGKVAVPANAGKVTAAELVHFNWNILGGLPTVTMRFAVEVYWGGKMVGKPTGTLRMNIDETSNFDSSGNRRPKSSCAYQPVASNHPACPDKVTMSWVSGNIDGTYWAGDGDNDKCFLEIDLGSGFVTQEDDDNPIPLKAWARCCPSSCQGASSKKCYAKRCMKSGNDFKCVEDKWWPADSRCSGPSPGQVCQKMDCVGSGCKTDIPLYPDSRCPRKLTTYCRGQDCVGTNCKTDLVRDDDTRCATEYLPTVNGKKVRRECYDGFCVPGAGKCSEVIKGSRGNAGGENEANHKGTCPVPSGYQPNCYWPYCDMNGQCAGDIYHGTPYPNYKPNYRPGYTCPVAPDRNGQCWFPRCINGNCGGDPWRMGEPCTPKPDEIDKTHDAQCVYYICGSAGAELGKCVSRPRPGGKTWPCSDNDKCTFDWCDNNGFCAIHEHKKCATGDMCLKSWCDPGTGECVPPVRNGDACCPDGKIDEFENCEPGIDGSDAQCCIHCLKDDTAPCTDNNECTVDKCVNGKCVSTLDRNKLCGVQNKSDICALKLCVPDEDDIGICERRPDPAKDGKACGEHAPKCNWFVCEDAECVVRIDPKLIGKSCTPDRGAPQAPACNKYVCVEQSDKTGQCQLVADEVALCSDNDLCTSERCVADPKTGLGTCQFNVSRVNCSAEPPECFGPRVCDPKTGKCSAFVPLTNISCTPKDQENLNGTAPCFDWMCVKGECVRNCPCGNGILDEGEECDYAIPHQEGCCTLNCTGCWCGDGILQDWEECDYGIPEQAACCNSSCQGCWCGDGILQEGEECDPGMEKFKECCNATCQGCIPKKKKNVPGLIGAAVGAAVALGVVVAAAAWLGKSGAAASSATSALDMSAGAGSNNPLFQPMMEGGTNPLYQNL